MEEYIIREITRKLKWYEKIVVRMFKKTFLRVYNNTRVSLINSIEQR